MKVVESSKLKWNKQPKIDSGYIKTIIAYDVANEKSLNITSESSLLWNQYQDQENSDKQLKN